MRNLARIVIAISLAACKSDGTPITGPCDENPASLDCRCDRDPELPECDETIACFENSECESLGDGECIVGFCSGELCDTFNECEGQGTVSGELAAFPQENGNTFVGFVVDFSDAFDQFVDLDEANAAAVPIGECVDQEFPDIDGEPDRKAVGDVTVTKGGEAVTTLTFDAGTGRYEEIVTTILPGDTLDIAFPGDGAIGQHDFIGFAAMPAAFPRFGGVVNNQIDLSTGIVTFDPLTGTYVTISTSFIDPVTQQGVSLECGSDGSGTFMIPAATLARLPSSGNLNLSVTNRQFRALTTTDGILRTVRSFVRMTKSVQYTKP